MARTTEGGQREAPLARATVPPTATTAAARARVGERQGADHTRAARVAPNEISTPPTPPHPRNSGTPRQPFARGPMPTHATHLRAWRSTRYAGDMEGILE